MDKATGKQLILVFNCGSSSIKFALINMQDGQARLQGLAEALHTADARLTLNDGKSTLLPSSDYPTAMHTILASIQNADINLHDLCAIGHRVVHGGDYFSAPTLITDAVLDKIEACSALAPLHNPANLMGIRIAQETFAEYPHVAVFDTAFHQTMPKHAYLYALPHQLYEQHHIRRYGFHGVSHHYVTEQAAKRLNKPYDKCALISAHLGNGCSATAVLNGKSIDTSMGMTPLEGLVMGTRCGDLDPSIVTHLQTQCNYSTDDVNQLLNKDSGLLGISGLSMDMRAIEKAANNGNRQAQLAIDIFCYRLAKTIGSLFIALGRLDALVFTGGIGENAAKIRNLTCKQLHCINIILDETRNATHGDATGFIAADNSTPIYVVATDEEWMMAREILHSKVLP